MPAVAASNKDHQPQQPRPSHFRDEYKVAEFTLSIEEVASFNSDVANQIASLTPGESLIASGTAPWLNRQSANDSLLFETHTRCRNHAKANHPRLRARFLLRDIRRFIGRYLVLTPAQLGGLENLLR